jgi:hypothetical protein
MILLVPPLPFLELSMLLIFDELTFVTYSSEKHRF